MPLSSVAIEYLGDLAMEMQRSTLVLHLRLLSVWCSLEVRPHLRGKLNGVEGCFPLDVA
jgi:hypothetical protein